MLFDLHILNLYKFMSLDTQKNVNILTGLKQYIIKKMVKKYIPNEKEKYMCEKHKTYFKKN